MGQCLKPKHQRQKHRSYQDFRRKTKGGGKKVKEKGVVDRMERRGVKVNKMEGVEEMEWRRWSGDEEGGTEQNCRQNLEVAEITPILRV